MNNKNYMKSRKDKNTMKANNERKYEINLRKTFSDNDKYELRFHDLLADPLSHTFDFLILTRDDVVCVAKAVAAMNDNRICINQNVRRRYLSGLGYDRAKKEREFHEPNGYFHINVEVKDNHVQAGPYSRLYRVTFKYKNAFGEDDRFEFVMHEQDFIALGKAACEMLIPDDAIEKLLVQK